MRRAVYNVHILLEERFLHEAFFTILPVKYSVSPKRFVTRDCWQCETRRPHRQARYAQ